MNEQPQLLAQAVPQTYSQSDWNTMPGMQVNALHGLIVWFGNTLRAFGLDIFILILIIGGIMFMLSGDSWIKKVSILLSAIAAIVGLVLVMISPSLGGSINTALQSVGIIK